MSVAYGNMGTITHDVLMASIMMTMIGLVGVVGNLLMLRALIMRPKLRTDFYTVFGGLSIADTLSLLISVPYYVTEMHQLTDLDSELWCKGSTYLMHMCGFVAAFLMVVLSALRGILLLNRNTIRQPRGMHLLIVNIVFYVVALVCSVPTLQLYSYSDGFCFKHKNIYIQETWLVGSFSAFIPLCLASVIYMVTYIMGLRYCSDSYSRRDKEQSRLVTCMLVAFAVCQLPYRIMAIYYSYVDDFSSDFDNYETSITIKNYLLCLVMADKAIRPVLYSKITSDLSESFDEIVNCTCCTCKCCCKIYNLVPVFENSLNTNVEAGTTQSEISTIAGSYEARFRDADRTQSTSSSGSATSHTPLIRREDEVIELSEEVR